MEPVYNKESTPVKPVEKSQGLWQIAMRKFFRNKTAVFGLIVLFFVLLVAIFAPLIAPFDPERGEMNRINKPPGPEYKLGTDGSGRDAFSRLVYGARLSLIIGFSAMVFTAVIGVTLGALSGYYGRWVDTIIMRATDIMLNFPFLLLVLIIVSILKRVDVIIFVTVIALTSWPSITRIIRATFLSLREQEYIMSAQTLGLSDARIIFRHLLPNAMGPIIVNATLFMSTMIITESALSFIGFGIPQPTPTWGNMLSDALSLRVLKTQPWLWVPPGLAIVLTVISINFIGDGLRDALDPRFNKQKS